MKLQRSPISHTCLATSFAMVLGVDAQDLIDCIGSNPHEILWPQLEEPQCFRGHHIQELIDQCYLRGYSVTEIQAMPRFGALGCTETHLLFDQKQAMRRIQNRVSDNTCVITSETHAVACDGKIIYDPKGTMYPIADYTNPIQSVYVLNRT